MREHGPDPALHGKTTKPLIFRGLLHSRMRLIVTASDHWRLYMTPDNQCDLDRVISFQDWCKRADVSESTGRRLLASKRGPKVTRLSNRRIGIRERDHIAW